MSETFHFQNQDPPCTHPSLNSVLLHDQIPFPLSLWAQRDWTQHPRSFPWFSWPTLMPWTLYVKCSKAPSVLLLQTVLWTTVLNTKLEKLCGSLCGINLCCEHCKVRGHLCRAVMGATGQGSSLHTCSPQWYSALALKPAIRWGHSTCQGCVLAWISFGKLSIFYICLHVVILFWITRIFHFSQNGLMTPLCHF